MSVVEVGGCSECRSREEASAALAVQARAPRYFHHRPLRRSPPVRFFPFRLQEGFDRFVRHLVEFLFDTSRTFRGLRRCFRLQLIQKIPDEVVSARALKEI